MEYRKIMDVHAEPGTKVVFAFPQNGYPAEKAITAQFLSVGSVYTIARTDVHDSSTTVYLVEFPGMPFNNCSFAGLIQ
jgi:hypothetical protein